MITKKDYLIAALSGLLTGVFALAVLFFLNISFPLQAPAVIFTVPVLWVLGVWLGGFLGKRVAPFFTNFGKFAAVGFSSAAIDFAILNYISYLTGVTAGVTVGWINIPGFLVAVLNGYLWNKLWVFKKPELASEISLTPTRQNELARPRLEISSASPGLLKDFPEFFGVTFIGLLINNAIIILLTTYFPMPSLSDKAWLNIAKVIANAIALIWNFAGYKFFAFK